MLLGLFRREALPLAVLCALALVVQLVAGTFTAAATSGDSGLKVLCIGGQAADGDAQPAPGHGKGICPCGPVCPHGTACLTGGCASAAVSVRPVLRVSSPRFVMRDTPPGARALLASGGIRAPPVPVSLPV
ncbi:hypothetical protein [Stappia sp.]|uniref:hypothetical protein n=1 Tax=Stappia sp. TaxID=1870903 RepID=UPI003D0D9610